jgi:hypothetical protein
MTRQLVLLGTVFCACLVAGSGCGGYGTVRVEGIVTLDGAPVGAATVTFIPVDEKGGHHAASGVTNQDGRFRLTTFNTNDGALPGHYRVTVTQVESTFKNASDSSLAEDRPQVKMMDRNRNKSPDLQRKVAAERKKNEHSKLPAVYGDPKRTTLKWEVPTRGDVRLELDSKAQ